MIKEINFTKGAVERINSLITKKPQGTFFRIAVKGGGCSGFLYDIKIEPEPRSDDLIIEFDEDNLKVCLDPQSNFMLSETTVDYEVSLVQSGFKFVNKSATKSCGCGQSFSCG